MPGMTPEFSRQMALIAPAPIWQSLDGMKQWDVFIRQASRYPTYAALPPDLKESFKAAQRSLGAPISDASKALARLTGVGLTRDANVNR